VERKERLQDVDFQLPLELLELQAVVRQIVRDKIEPRAREIDDTGEYPQDIFDVFRDAGLLGLSVPDQYGGSGAGILGLVVAVEEVAKVSNTCALMLLLSRLPLGPLLTLGSEEQRQAYIPGIASGVRRAAFGLSEPQAGSDVAGMRTRAVRDPDGGWRLSGTKCWMSGIAQADWFTVFAKVSEPGSEATQGRDHDKIAAFIVERDEPGVSVGSLDRKMGIRGIDTGQLHLDDVRVPAAAKVGDGGFATAMSALNAVRPVVAARGIGLAQGALMYSTRYVQQRDAFGSKVADFQGIQWEIAKVAVDIEAARLLTYRAAAMIDSGKLGKDAAPYLSMAKYHATELAVRASGLSVQLLGAAGYMKDHLTELFYRDARQLTIVEGTSQVQLGLIGRAVLDRRLWWDDKP
jgi:alkylation response protein AidB-like acyl-CoA dehydrogenase